ncbi:hypothetical protein PSU4_04040 [Pseudonocardia sulfidoxydans NBRC 16205]|uniref:Uncharacterized protein n=1 Tax=Pseudonocardia sulfidoxydans NBRC 16205 TaxID=1223511 RepID=A0A511D9G4_9PSEU|nr:hypothetical protein [Pseudonocardia sulfidoxydans]GEL21450.1 hypothetical protein PSU4_04040 [Pseudonocardia sulfidoxydans NBRC 16205]
MSEDAPDRVEDAAEELYGVAPDDFVPVRDELVAAAREAGDRDAARAIAKLRRPTQAAWLANLLARERATQLDGLLSLAADLNDAQRTLDGSALRALSAQRGKLVAAMAREARALAGRDGHKVAESTERDLRGILDAALADADIAEQVRSGRLHRTVSYSGFGPDALAGAEPRPAPRRREPEAGSAQDGVAQNGVAQNGVAQNGVAQNGVAQNGVADDPWAMPDDAAARAEQERRARELAEARRSLDDARSTAGEARDREEAERRAHEEAERRLADAKARVADLAAELEEARAAQRDATESERSAAAELREAAARTRAAAADVERAQAKVADLS